MGSKSAFLRDMRKRLSLREVETQRAAHLFVARNTTLPAQVRHRAQLALNNLNGGGEGRPGAVKNRCIETGRGRGIMSAFGLCRVSELLCCRVYLATCWVRGCTRSVRRCWLFLAVQPHDGCATLARWNDKE